MPPYSPDVFLQHGILGGFVLVMLVGIGTTFRLINRLIDTLHHTSREQVEALMSVEHAVKDSIVKSDERHSETMSTFLKSLSLISETREALRKWTNHCSQYCGYSTNGHARKDGPSGDSESDIFKEGGV